jgi:hypothetical protein
MTEETAAVETTATEAPSESLLDAVQPADIFANGKPEGMPDEFWNAEKKTPNVEKIYESYNQAKARADGLRVKLSKGEFEGGAPEDIKDYAFEMDDKIKAIVPDGDPLFEAARQAAKDAGMPKEAFAKFMAPVLSKIAEMQPAEPTAEEIASYRASELEKLGPSGLRIAANVKAFVGELQAKGVLMEDDVKVVQGMITNADQLRAWNRIRSAMGNAQDVPVGEDFVNTQASRAELESQLVAAASARDEAKYNQISMQLSKLR